MPNKWTEHVYEYAKKNNLTYRQALCDAECKNEYNKIEGGSMNDILQKSMTGFIDTPINKPVITPNLVGKIIKNDYGEPPNVSEMLKKYGDAQIIYIKINRKPVDKMMTWLLNLLSKNRNNFNKELNKLPYDKLYHLQMIFSTSKGRVVLEKNERINMSEKPKESEFIFVEFPPDLTIRKIYDNAKRVLGYRFYKYNAYTANCQDFVMGLLKGSNLQTNENILFTKQDTKTLFSKDPRLRKIANTTTDMGAMFNALMQGGELDEEDEEEEEEEKITYQIIQISPKRFKIINNFGEIVSKSMSLSNAREKLETMKNKLNGIVKIRDNSLSKIMIEL